MEYRPAFIALACLLSLSTTCAAQSSPTSDKSPQQKQPIHWPDSDRPQLHYTEEEISFDGGIIHVGHLTGPSLNWETGFPLQWEQVANSDKRFSVLFKHRGGAPTFFAISVFDEKEFLPDLSAENWSRFTSDLGEGKEEFTILAETSTLEEEGEGPYILGNPTRTILYSWTDARRSKRAEMDLFFRNGKTLIVFRLIGPLANVSEQKQEFTRRSTQIGEWRFVK